MISDNSVLDRLVEKLGKQTVLQARLHLPTAATINWWRKRGVAWGMRVKVHTLAVSLGIAVPDGWITTPPKGEPDRVGTRGAKPKPKRRRPAATPSRHAAA
jgi:hypothetical protein